MIDADEKTGRGGRSDEKWLTRCTDPIDEIARLRSRKIPEADIVRVITKNKTHAEIVVLAGKCAETLGFSVARFIQIVTDRPR